MRHTVLYLAFILFLTPSLAPASDAPAPQAEAVALSPEKNADILALQKKWHQKYNAWVKKYKEESRVLRDNLAKARMQDDLQTIRDASLRLLEIAREGKAINDNLAWEEASGAEFESIRDALLKAQKEKDQATMSARGQQLARLFSKPQQINARFESDLKKVLTSPVFIQYARLIGQLPPP